MEEKIGTRQKNECSVSDIIKFMIKLQNSGRAIFERFPSLVIHLRYTKCWCNHNNNRNNTTRNWIILLNIISIKKGITQQNLDWGAALAFFKEIQALSWLNFVTGADILWLVSPRIQQPLFKILHFSIIKMEYFDTSTLHLPLRTYLAQYLRQYILDH